jgi:hypothetical protein
MISTQRKAFLLLGLAFLAGLLTGGAAIAMASRGDDGPRPGRRAAWYLDHLSRSLDLSAGQRDSVRSVLDRYGPRMDTLMQEIRPRLDTLRSEMRGEIERFLDEGQRKEFERMRQQHQRERREGGADARH